MALTCKHGLTDSCDVTFRICLEDYVMNTKHTTINYFCQAHRRHGNTDIREKASRVLDIDKISRTLDEA